MGMDGSGEVVVQFDVCVDPEAAVPRPADAITDEDLGFAVRELVEGAERAKHGTLNTLAEQLDDLAALRTAQGRKSFPVGSVTFSYLTPSAGLRFLRLGIAEEVTSELEPVTELGDAFLD